jgi:hypothetical protein
VLVASYTCFTAPENDMCSSHDITLTTRRLLRNGVAFERQNRANLRGPLFVV